MGSTRTIIFFAFVANVGITSTNGGSYGGYVKCTDGSSPQKDGNGQTISCTPGQNYGACQDSYQCMTPLPGRAGVCCKSGYGGGTQGEGFLSS